MSDRSLLLGSVMPDTMILTDIHARLALVPADRDVLCLHQRQPWPHWSTQEDVDGGSAWKTPYARSRHRDGRSPLLLIAACGDFDVRGGNPESAGQLARWLLQVDAGRHLYLSERYRGSHPVPAVVDVRFLRLVRPTYVLVPVLIYR